MLALVAPSSTTSALGKKSSEVAGWSVLALVAPSSTTDALWEFNNSVVASVLVSAFVLYSAASASWPADTNNNPPIATEAIPTLNFLIENNVFLFIKYAPLIKIFKLFN